MKRLFIISDGGGENRVNFDSVKIPLMLLFWRLQCNMPNLQHMVVIRTAPNNSWLNTVERIMSILNYSLQNVALARVQSPSDENIKKCSNMSDLRQSSENIKEDWLASVKPVIDTVKERMEAMSLKGKAFKVIL